VPKGFEDELVQLQDLLGDVFNDDIENYNICDTLIDEVDTDSVPDKQIIQPGPPTSLSITSSDSGVSGNRDAQLKKNYEKSSPHSNPETTEILIFAPSPLEKPGKEVFSSDCSPSITANSSSAAVVDGEVSKDLDIPVQILPEKYSEIDKLSHIAPRTVEIDSEVSDFQSTQQDIFNTPLPSPMHCIDDNCSSSFCPRCSAFKTEAAYIESEPQTPSTITSIGSPYTPSTSGHRKKTYKTDNGKKRKAHKENWLITQRKK
jgi:hypothetical protein